MPTHYFYGEDTYQARQAIGVLAQNKHASIRWVDKEELQQQAAADVVGQQGGLFGAILPVIRDPSRLAKATQEALLAYLNDHADLELVLWDRESVKRPNVFVKAAKAQQFSYEGEATTVTWVSQEVTKQGGTITPAAAKMLVERAGQNRWQLKNIIERLLLTNSTITPDQITAELEVSNEAEIFATLQAILNRQKDVALQSITTLLEAGNSELYILSMLAWQFKTLTMVKRGSVLGLTPAATAARFGLKPFVVTKSLPRVQGVTYEYLLDRLTKILATDVAIKQGKVEARTGLMMLILAFLE